ncbi:type VI secretion system ImpA family N-terminal domain-containing protein [Sulfitobacter albidus]|uniref:Type VI secretion system ImpA family N-terminal domain-containing protein n=1 Tax=Sulfitobacter albidus TaxID=2829501 RepID=A0A975PNY4_9RHOB|nr:type VI secretion system ImpA family N-terminal domain-containing protein [Sulfitobacter albidus]QUJ78244.1 type VI secretion system ImpA family N-terminal domain-containing protein [Sulfitobacter albidus]
MSLGWISEPVDPETPAGADLFETDDPIYSEYYFDALGRLPEADDYARIGLSMGDGAKQPDTIFDPKSVALNAELSAIDALLARSRDVRLLTLRTQWFALAAEPEGMVNSIAAIADLLEAMPELAHPATSDGPRDRLDALNDLAAVGPMILPIRYLDIAGTGASRRRVMVARGKLTAHDGEDDLSIDAMFAALSKSRERVTEVTGQLTGMLDALTRIENACLANERPHTPQFGALRAEIEGILEIIAEADPDLAPQNEADEAGESVAEAAAPKAAAVVTSEVQSHEDARARLVATESYFAHHEPSSAAVLLVTQARMLIGKSLIDAFEVLMPNSAPFSKVAFITDNGFQLAHPQLRTLANEMLTAPPPEPEPQPEPAPPPPAPPEAVTPVEETLGSTDDEGESESGDDDHAPDTDEERNNAPEAVAVEADSHVAPAPVQQPTPIRVRDSAEASAQILAVETYFRAVEKSSPLPMLLARARSYIGKDFESLLKELVPTGDF